SKGVKDELIRLSKSRKQISIAAGSALKEIAANGVKVLPSTAVPDAWLLNVAGSGIFICTNDIALKRKLRKKGANVFSITRSGKIL
ncbi:MAG: hypothetical protein QXY86_01655, partial [Candidatus Micrarchaeaceae archaeon]